MTDNLSFTAFVGTRQVASGSLEEIVRSLKNKTSGELTTLALVFDDKTGRVVDLDLRDTAETAVRRLADHPLYGAMATRKPQHRGPGRPKLGVVAREVTLLPRHWDWLNAQPGGASVTLRRLVDEARRLNAGIDRICRAQEAAYRFMSAMAGDETGYEEATRALFARDHVRFDALTRKWPADIRSYAAKLSETAFAPAESSH